MSYIFKFFQWLSSHFEADISWRARGKFNRCTTHLVAYLADGSRIRPVATMKNEYGNYAHIWLEDNCYCLGIDNSSVTELPDVKRARAIFADAFEVMKSLPSPIVLQWQIEHGMLEDGHESVTVTDEMLALLDHQLTPCL